MTSCGMWAQTSGCIRNFFFEKSEGRGRFFCAVSGFRKCVGSIDPIWWPNGGRESFHPQDRKSARDSLFTLEKICTVLGCKPGIFANALRTKGRGYPLTFGHPRWPEVSGYLFHLRSIYGFAVRLVPLNDARPGVALRAKTGPALFYCLAGTSG